MKRATSLCQTVTMRKKIVLFLSLSEINSKSLHTPPEEKPIRCDVTLPSETSNRIFLCKSSHKNTLVRFEFQEEPSSVRDEGGGGGGR